MSILSSFSKVDKEDIAVFLENMSFLLGCGYTPYDAVHWIIDSDEKKDNGSERIKKIGRSISKDLNEGYSLSASMIRNPIYFGEYAKQIEAAEESGQVADVLDQIVSYIRESADIQKKIKGAMTYPAIVLVLTLGVTAYLFSTVIPRILNTLAGIGGGEIPPMTQMVMNITDWFKQYGVILMLFLVAAVLVLIFLSKGPLKRTFSKLATQVPIVKNITLATNAGAWMSSMRYMLSAGSPMANAMLVAADSIKNIYMKEQAKEAYELFSTSGMAVSEALKKCTFFTAIELGTINIGLESGEIEEVLKRLAQRRKDESDKAISTFIAFLNPALIAFLGVIVGIVVMSVYGPLINVTSSITG